MLVGQASWAQTVNPPTMGWSSWNTFALNISESLIKQQADAMVSTGLADAGYNYVNIDDGYWNGRSRDGKLILNTQRFPSGMRSLTDYIHGLGLKAGIYSDAGDNTCGSGNSQAWGLNVGFFDHEDEDCQLYFDDWNFDFIKVDYCGGNHLSLNEQLQYTRISNAIRRQAEKLGKRIVFNVCRWAYPGTWISDIADSWRTTGDIWCDWTSVRDLIKENLYIQAYTGGGHYNDIDMLEIGRTLSHDEEVTHMAYWCIASSPLLIGCDMANIPEASLELLKNKDLIAMNQDPLGLGAPVVQRMGDVYVVAKDMEQLHGPKRAVVVMNLSDGRRQISLDLKALEMTGAVRMHDCLTGKDTDYAAGSRINVVMPAHGSQAYFITGERIDRVRYQGEEAWANKYQEISGFPSARHMEASGADQGWYMGWLGNLVGNYMEWRNVHSQLGGRYKLTIRYATAENRNLQIHVNGEDLGFLDNLNSGGWDDAWKTVDIEVTLKPGFNVVRLGEPVGFAPNIDYIELTPLQSASIEAAAEEHFTPLNHRTYDLQGRPVTASTTKGPVIIDNRIVLN
ncbi:MAG: carbohydrate-binding protein [Prevotella sp.]|nr:carbohydrate-binding protein [Prevotella sp.]MBQ3753312.1 carbohydrate-binding protein [Prevotella sp.]